MKNLVSIFAGHDANISFYNAKTNKYIAEWVSELLEFDDDKKDAGDMGIGHSATALYEIVPKKKHEMAFHPNEDLLHIKFRYKLPKKDKSRLLEKQVFVNDIGQHTRNFNFSAAVAGFAMLLRDSEHKGNLTYDKVLTLGMASVGKDEDGLRHEFVELVKKVKAWNV